MKIFGTRSIFYPACLKVDLWPNWKRWLGTLSYMASHLVVIYQEAQNKHSIKSVSKISELKDKILTLDSMSDMLWKRHYSHWTIL